jgi:general secretion pathway protein A
VILDEAHLIDGEALTDIRLLVGSALDDAPPRKVVLPGQGPLQQTLRHSLHAARLSRISVRFHLAPLAKEQTASDIDFQLQQAGGSEKLFEEAAKGLIHDYSGGVPRQINNLATACSLQAAAQNASRVSEALFRRSSCERSSGLPAVPGPPARP